MDETMAEWCDSHRDRIKESGVPVYIIEALIVQATLATPDFDRVLVKTECWACPISEERFQDCIRQAAVLDAQSDQLGGSFTNENLSISKGGGYAYPTDKESSEK